ncbi:hypothetical protein [Oceanirhabdus sp. W0125-5]|uniref:hypothetical protein n=1 Tax=Oceanirhabdus sp. W0125-5 TaxID=2999116 RepID=UPI0022F2FA04|nr:hypothetical protein [Oceanirhabdus sp. W0125-5]WBW97165.1 hypothetical protein OW730_26275 [Oceanirhabdus sp. W0125-5]
MDSQVKNTIVKEKNKITIILVFIGICFISFFKFVFKMDFSDVDTAARSLGYLLGSIIGRCVIVFGISELIYKVSKKSKNKIILIMSIIYLVSSIGMLSNKISQAEEKKQNEYKKITLAEEKIRLLMNSSLSEKKIEKEDITYEKYGQAQECVSFVQDLYSEVQLIEFDKNDQIYELNGTLILSYNTVSDINELLDVRMKINQSIDSLNEYYDSIYKIYETYVEKIKTFNDSNDYSKNFAIGFNQTVQRTLNKLTYIKNAHTDQYKFMDNILKFLEEKEGKYEFHDEQLIFFTNEDVDEYNKLIDEYNNSVDVFTKLINDNDEKVKEAMDFLKGEEK